MPPDEWIGALGRLNDYQLQQGMRRLLYRKGGPPSLPEFMTLCRTVGQDDSVADEPQRSQFTSLPSADDAFDEWAIEANNHLMAHVLRNLREKRCFNAEETRILVRYKNAWADDMRAIGPAVPVDVQKAAWKDVMEGAAQAMVREIAA